MKTCCCKTTIENVQSNSSNYIEKKIVLIGDSTTGILLTKREKFYYFKICEKYI